MRRTEIRKLYKLSNSALDRMVEMGIIEYFPDTRDYQAPWGEIQMFRPKDVASFLTRVTGEYWTVRQVLYVHEDLFFDLHQGRCERRLNRVTLHDFRSIVESVDSTATCVFDNCFARLG